MFPTSGFSSAAAGFFSTFGASTVVPFIPFIFRRFVLKKLNLNVCVDFIENS
jgi:hypothetical protein